MTGGLVFNRKYFMQVLEGDRLVVTKLFASISSDLRHSLIELVETRSIDKRQFGPWAMGFASSVELIKKRWEKFAIQGEFNPKLLTAEQIVALILDVVKEGESVAS